MIPWPVPDPSATPTAGPLPTYAPAPTGEAAPQITHFFTTPLLYSSMKSRLHAVAAGQQSDKTLGVLYMEGVGISLVQRLKILPVVVPG